MNHSVSVFAQGNKRINLGGTIYHCDPGSFLLASIDVPVESQVVTATPKKPVLAMMLRLNMQIVREVISEADLAGPEIRMRGTGLGIGQANDCLLDICRRMVTLLDRPNDVRYLSSLLHREFVYELLKTPQSSRLRAIATSGDLSRQTAKAIAWLKSNYEKPLRMQDLARIADMGVSTLHHQFRALTSMTPLQYQKQLRLHAAKQQMLVEGIDATTAAFGVGYTTVSQFNREYSRHFGRPPIRDIQALRASA